jgi:hypothetical protein
VFKRLKWLVHVAFEWLVVAIALSSLLAVILLGLAVGFYYFIPPEYYVSK